MDKNQQTMRERYQNFQKHRLAFHPGARSWYAINAKDDTAEVFIYDAIGMFGIEAQDFINEFESLDAKNITLRINSPGGDVFDGAAMYNAIESHPARVTARIEGLAASMASVLALAADEIEMAKNAFFMIHDPWSLVIGSASDMRKEADLLDKVGGTIVDTYVARSNLSEPEVRDAMADETWYTAQEAKDAGFIDKIIESGGAKASFDLTVFSHTPDSLQASREPAEITERDTEKALRDAGFSRSQAKAVVRGGFKAIDQREADDREDDAAIAATQRFINSLQGA